VTKVEVVNNIQVQTVAEFTGSGDFPDIITLENNYLRITSIPKRGSVIHSLVDK
jgi:hypothetical protein